MTTQVLQDRTTIRGAPELLAQADDRDPKITRYCGFVSRSRKRLLGLSQPSHTRR